MKTKAIISSLIILFIGISFNSCKKEETEEPTKPELLTKAVWHFNKVEEYDVDGNLIDTDDIENTDVQLTKDHKWIFIETDSGDRYEYEWDLNYKQDKIYLIFDNEVYPFNITKLTDNEFIITHINNPSSPLRIMKRDKASRPSAYKEVWYLSR